MTGARVARFGALLICLLFGIGNTAWSVINWDPVDMEAYLNAAYRLREGEPLYPVLANVDAADVYRYAPWFAYLWVPLTFLPKSIVAIGWSTALTAASLAVVFPLLRLRRASAMALCALLGSFLIFAASRGNVQPLMIAALTYGVERRSGPVWIALCASLKATPILLAAVYAVRGQYRRAVSSAVITALLVAPMAFAGLESYPSDPGATDSIWAVSPFAFWIAAIAILAGALVVARNFPRLQWLSAAVGVLMTLPRAFAYDTTYLFVGAVPAVPGWRGRDEERPTRAHGADVPFMDHGRKALEG